MSTVGIDIPHPHFGSMTEDWCLIDALRGGTRGMREAGETYLPRRPMETQGDYDARISAATLFPGFSETIKSMVGRVFAMPLVIDDSVPTWIRDEVLPDIDMRGRNLHVFAIDWFREALEYGLSHVIVESPKAPDVRTRAEQKAANLRPYAVRFHPRDVIGWRVDDSGRLTQLRIKARILRDAGPYGVEAVDQIKLYEIGKVTTFERQAKDSTWEQVDEATMALDRIPLITLYTKRTGFLTAEPPLRELAYLNAKHWWMQSGSDTLLDTASVPILTVAGVQDGDDIVIGGKHAVRMPSGAEMKYVEHTGAAIGAGRVALDSLKDEMRQAGAKLLTTGDVAKNTLQAGQEAARENSELGSMVQTLEDTIADMLDLIAEWRGEKSGGRVQAQPNLDADFAPVESMGVLITMRDAGVLSDETLFAEAKRRNLVSDEVEWEVERERIATTSLPAP